MSQPARSSNTAARRRHAAVLAALGHETRLALVGRLASGEACSITQLSRRTGVTRQAITKHLHVLEQAGVVAGERAGREIRYSYRPDRMVALGEYLEMIAAQWDQALGRLKAFIEDSAPDPG